MLMKENFKPKNLFADAKETEAEQQYEPMTSVGADGQDAQALVERGLF